MKNQNPTNEFCPNCKHADKGLNEYPCRNCAVAHAIVNHYEPVDEETPEFTVTKVVYALEGPFDKATVYLGCAVQVLENTKTGQISIGWTRSQEIIDGWINDGMTVEEAYEW